MKKLFSTLILSLFLAILLPQTAYSAPGDCCTDSSGCETAFGETCTGTSFVCSKQGQKSCVRPAATPTGTTHSCQSPFNEYCQNAPPGGTFNCITQGTCTGGVTRFCCTLAPLPTPQNSGNIRTCSPSIGTQGIETAIGCIPTGSSQEFAGFVLRWAIGIGGGIAFLLLLYGAIQVMTSSGDPKRLQAGQELITATISGLLFIIFSVFLLRIIGVNILGIFN